VNEIQVVVTGLAWMGAGIRSIEVVLDELLQSAQDEIWITAYSISNLSNRFSGKIESVLARGVKVHLIINRLDTQAEAVVRSLRSLALRYPFFHLYSFEGDDEMVDLHAKIVVVDNEKALVGSANISFRGWTTNHELAVLISGPAVNEISKTVTRLRNSRFCREINYL